MNPLPNAASPGLALIASTCGWSQQPAASKSRPTTLRASRPTSPLVTSLVVLAAASTLGYLFFPLALHLSLLTNGMLPVVTGFIVLALSPLLGLWRSALAGVAQAVFVVAVVTSLHLDNLFLTMFRVPGLTPYFDCLLFFLACLYLTRRQEG